MIEGAGGVRVALKMFLSLGSPVMVDLWIIRVHTVPGILTLVWFGLDRARHENTPPRT